MDVLVTRLSDDASEASGANEERWATDSDYGLSERQLHEAAANKGTVGAVEEANQARSPPKSDSFWTALLAGLPFLSELTACTTPCYAAHDVSRLPSQDTAQYVSCAEEVINGTAASPPMLGRPPSTHSATLIIERSSDVNELHRKGEPSTFFIGDETQSQDPTDGFHNSETMTMFAQRVQISAKLGMVAKSKDGVHDSVAISPKQDSKTHLSRSHESEKLGTVSKTQDTSVHTERYGYRESYVQEPEPEEPEPESEDCVE